MHHAEDRLAEPRQSDQRAPGRHPADERFGAVDRIEHPNVFGIGAVVAEFLADDAVIGKGAADQGPHRALGGAVRLGHRVETSGDLALDRKRGAEEGQDRVARNGGELVDKSRKIDCRHAAPPVPIGRSTYAKTGMAGNLVVAGAACNEKPDEIRMTRQEQKLLSASAAVFVGTLIAFYMVSQFMRNSVGVIAPDLAAELSLSAADIGFLSSAFFFSFAAVQLPLGIALDRFGPRTVLLVCAVITVVGAIMFAVATSAAGLTVARVLMGIGCSSSLMAPLALYAKRFPPERFATLTGLPARAGHHRYAVRDCAARLCGRRHRLAGNFRGRRRAHAAGGTVGCDRGQGRGAAGKSGAVRRETFRENVAGLLAVMRTPSVGSLFLMHFTSYATFALLVGLWGAPYLTDVYGYDLKARGDLLLLPVIAQIVGSLLWGPMDRVLDSYKRPVLLGAGLTTVTLFSLAARRHAGFHPARWPGWWRSDFSAPTRR